MTTEPSGAPVAHADSSRTASPTVGIIGLAAVILGGILSVVGFLGAIDAALNGSGSGSAFYTAVFVGGGVLIVAGFIVAIVRLIRGRTRVLSVVTIVLALLPVIGAIVLRVVALGAS